MKKFIYLIVLTLILGLVLNVSSQTLLDSVNIGDITSEAGHDLQGWSNPWVKPGWGGNYGGGSDDESLRLLMGPGDGCAGHEDAYFTMSAGCNCADKLVLHHLDGTQPDDFDVFILDDGTDYNSIGSYAQQTDGETWETSEYVFSLRGGDIHFKLVATSPVMGWCAGWGQVGFSWADLWGGACPVTIDIKPGSDPNSINLGSNGVVPVAILSSPDFDAATVDPSTVTLAGATVKFKGKSGNAGSLEDVNGDGLLDLVVQVYTSELSELGDGEIFLIAYTYDCLAITGSDSVRIVPQE